ncbi:restriction endonuclease subunit S [Fusicatenibacter faecihominis]|uniref:Restriction endonuclease subunit S n=1 Tax=Fusicatenibacter faecihominis TaxID=2881276 RepID=A0AAE3DVQ9_9FIRM|nr:restriction endonuclease subunit S [Fusicatenibacter faecihominis]MCC2191251.1 restriction endonuclease subunit S [Fusicatenibacter faecihominis]
MEKIKIKALIKQVRGVSYKPEDLHNKPDENSVVLLRANNIADGQINFDDVVYVDKSKVSPEQYLKKGDILICASSGSKNLVGKAASVTFEKECTFGAFCKVIRSNADSKDLLSVYFQSSIYRKKIAEVAIGANINNIRNEHIDNLDIPVYSAEERMYIVDKIKLAQNIIDKRKEELSCLNELIKARFVEMFGDAVDNPMGWEKKQLQEIVTDDCTISYGIVQTGNDQEEGVPVFRPVDIVNRIPKLEELKRTTEEISNKYKRTILKGHEMLITVRANIADTCIVGKEFKGCNVGRGIVPIRTQENIMVLEFLKYLMDSKHLNDDIKSKAKGITLIQLNMEDLREVELIIPPIEQQKAFVKFAEQVNKSKVIKYISTQKLCT